MAFFRKKSCFGLDIKDQKICMIDINKSGSRYEIRSYGEAPVPQGYIEGNTVINEDGVTDILRQLAISIGAESSKIAVAVSGDNVIARNLLIPVMPDNELGEAVRFETEAQIPLPGKDVTIDFAKYNIIDDGKVKKQEVLAVAVKNEVIDRMVRIISSSGLQPVIMDIEPLVLLRAIKTLNPAGIPQDKSYAIVNIGSSSTNISVFRGDQMFFTRTLGFGIYKLSLSLAAYYNIPFEQAETAVKQAAIASESSGSEEGHQADELLIPKINGLITEVRRSMDYYQSQNPGQEITDIFITGMGASINGLADYMNVNMEFRVSVFNPLQFLQVSAKLKNIENKIREKGPDLSQVIGLALSEAK